MKKEIFIEGEDGLIALSRISKIALAILVSKGIVTIILPTTEIILSGKLGEAVVSRVANDLASLSLAKKVEVFNAD